MAQLAIKGHKTRGKEVIEILEMLGGINKYNITYTEDNLWYCLRSKDNVIIATYPNSSIKTVLSIEEFLEKFPYKLNELVLCDNGLLGIITRMEWDCEKSDMRYHISFNTSVYNKWYYSKNIKCKFMAEKDKKLAIKGHPTRGKEVIELLEMMGGVNPSGYLGYDIHWIYIINSDGEIAWDYPSTCNYLTLKEFLEKFPYKVGDRVRIPEYESEVCISKMYWDGSEVQYEVVTDEVEWYSAKELNEFNDPNKEETINEMLAPVRKIGSDEILYYVDKNNGDIKENKEKKINQMSLANCDLDEVEIVLGDKFELKIREGKYYAIRKKILYPKTYGECCEVLGYEPDEDEINCYQGQLIESFVKLLICRAAYWKIAGEQMGLDVPWVPDWTDSNFKYCIKTIGKTVECVSEMNIQCLLAFPTEEMRDAFYKNFRDLIERCKELL